MKIIFEQPIPLSYKRDFEERVLVVSEDLEKINYLTDENNLLGVDLLLKNSETCDFDKIKNTILRVVADVFLSSKKIIHNVIYENNVTDLSYNDPHESLIDNREIIQTGSGQFIFQGNFLKIINNLDTLFKTEFINMGCNEQHYPLIFNAGPLFKINYFQTMGHHLFFPKSLRADYKIIQEFSERNKGSNNKTQKIDFSTDDFSSSNNILSPTVCFHCFSALANTTLEKEYYSFTGTNKCVRQERSAATGLERLNTFNMREAIFIGDEELIKNTYRTCESFAKDIFGKKLNLKFRIKTANDPFFGRTGVKKQIYQRAFTLKLEIQVYLPYVEKYVACGSINNHISTMSDAFQFKSKSGNKYESMCIGIGFERLALAILAQKGFSSKKANEFIYSTSNTIG